MDAGGERSRDVLVQTAAWVKSLDGWPRGGVAIVAGALSVLSLAPFFVWPVMFLTLPVLVWLIDAAGEAAAKPDASPRWYSSMTGARAFFAGWLFGFGYFAAGLFWVGEAFLVEADKFAWLLPFAVTLLPAGLALFWGLAALVTLRASRPGLSRILTLAVALGGVEWLRGHVFTGFPWNLLGYTLTSSDALMQSASVVGVYSLSFWAVLVFATPLVLLAAEPRRYWRALSFAAGPLSVMGLYGAWQLSQPTLPDVPGVTLRIVQPSIPQREKWLPEKQGEIFRLHLALSQQTPDGKTANLDGITHIVWPEAAMPFRPLDHPEALSAIKDLLGASTYLFAGGLRLASGANTNAPQRPDAYNSLMVFGPGGRLAALYDKIHLVPFGEYLPWQPALEAIGLQQLTQMRGGFSAGPLPRRPLAVAGLPPANILICYEAIFPGEVVDQAFRPRLIINVTNDGWFGNTTGPRHHFHQTRVRAVEEGLPVIRSANNGISAVIDTKGRVLQALGMNARGSIDSTLPAAAPPTIFANFGNILLLFHGVMFGLAAAILSGSGQRKS